MEPEEEEEQPNWMDNLLYWGGCLFLYAVMIVGLWLLVQALF